MAKSQEVSNKTLLILIVAVTVVTIVSTWFIVSSAFDAKAVYVDMEDNTASSEVGLFIEGDGGTPEEVPLVEAEPTGEVEVGLTIEESSE